jgi:hypothetical protein
MEPPANRDVKKKSAGNPAPRASAFPWSLVVAALLLAGSALMALRQPPRPEASGVLPFLSWDWWAYPLEINAESRLPYLTGAMTSAAFDPEGPGLLLGGQGGLLLNSWDRGRTWERVVLPDSLRRVHLPVSALEHGRRQRNGESGGATK